MGADSKKSKFEETNFIEETSETRRGIYEICKNIGRKTDFDEAVAS